MNFCSLAYGNTEKKLGEKRLDLYAKSALLMDAESGRILYEENGYMIMPIASTTKIMTCILALEYLEKNPQKCKNNPVIVSQKAQSMPKVHLGMQKGEEYKLEDLLYSLMLESHNDTAVAIAEYVAGSTEGFADLMNQKAGKLGCKNTYFITPNGLDAKEKGKEHSTSAYELALITRYAIKNKKFCEIINTPNYEFSTVDGKRHFSVYNHNRFLNIMQGAFGVKTGFTSNAGYCFVGALKRDERTFIAVVLACGWPPNKSFKWHDTKLLMEYGIDNFYKKCIWKKVDYPIINLNNGVKEKAQLCSKVSQKQKQKELTLLVNKNDQIDVKIKVPQIINAPLYQNQIVGYEYYYINGKMYKKYEILSQETVELRTYLYCVKKIFMLYF